MVHRIASYAISLFLLLIAVLFSACGKDKGSSKSGSRSDASAYHPASNVPMKKVPEGPPSFEIQGHRGCRGLRPENTWPAFRHALEMGVEVLELDVCLSADGQMVVSHEPWMNPEICIPRVSEPRAMHAGLPPEAPETEMEREFPFHFGWMTYADIEAWNCGGLKHPRFPEQRPQSAHKPLLSEILRKAEALADSLGQSVAYNIELKARKDWVRVYQPVRSVAFMTLLQVMRNSGAYERMHLQSFDHYVLGLAQVNAPELRVVQLEEHNPDAFAAIDSLGFPPEVYSPHYKLLDAATVAALQAQGIRVIPWTVNDTADMRAVRAMGVDGLITDYPDRAFALWANRLDR